MAGRRRPTDQLLSHDWPSLKSTLCAKERPYSMGIHLWGEQVWEDYPTFPTEEEFADVPTEIQEGILTQNLLFAMLGFRSALIGTQTVRGPKQCSGQGLDFERIQFLFSEEVDDKHAEYADPLLALAADRAYLVRFARELSTSFTYGLVNVALGTGILALCRELSLEVCAVWREVAAAESGQLALAVSSLAHYRRVFGPLTELVAKHEGRQGSSVIRVIEDFSQRLPRSDMVARCVDALLAHSCAPLFEMLAAWIYDGKLPVEADTLPIRESGSSEGLHYELSSAGLPLCLRQFASQIVQSGRLVLMLQRCGREHKPTRATLQYHPDPEFHAPIIEKAYHEANVAVLHHLRDQCKLGQRLRFFRDFLLVGSSVWFKDFLDSCEGNPACSMIRGAKATRWEELRRLGGTAIAAECAKHGYPADWAENLGISKADASLIRIVRMWAAVEKGRPLPPSSQEGTILGMMRLDCKLEWPLNLVLDWEKNATRYQFLGRLVMRVKGILHMLHSFRAPRPWRSKGGLAKGSRSGWAGEAGESRIRSFHALRTRMIGFLKSLEMYLLSEVIYPNFEIFESKVRQATTVEEVSRAHDTFLSDCLSASLADSETLIQKLEMTFLSCGLFAEGMKKMSNAHMVGHPSRVAPTDDCKDLVSRFEEQFMRRLSDLLQGMKAGQTREGEGEHDHRQSILNRVDFNKYYKGKGYYSDKIQ